MELKEYLHIIKKDFKLFVSIIVGVIIAVFGFFIFRPVAYNASLDLNITRIGSQETQSYKYDDFYRLQADEKFAETLVEWLKTPRIVSDIYDSAGISMEGASLRSLEKSFQVEKMSSQLVSVNYSQKDKKTAEKVAENLVKVIKNHIAALNTGQKETTWFEVVSNAPVIVMRNYSPLLALAGSLFGGIFLAFWCVMFKHYLD